MLPALFALVLKELIDAVVAAEAAASTTAIFTLVVAVFVLALLEGLTWFVERYLAARLRDDLEVELSSEVLAHASRLSLTVIEDPEQRDRIDRARARPGARVANLINELRVAVTMGVQAVSLFAVLIVIEPWVAAVVPAVALPFLIFQMRLGTRRYLERHDRITRERWSWSCRETRDWRDGSRSGTDHGP